MQLRHLYKSVLLSTSISALIFASGCTQNPATGQKQFTGLMSPQQEESIGAQQHQAIIKEYGGVYNHPGIQAYVNEIGQKMAAVNERKEVQYRFTVLDSPIVNAFALPGGYIYVTRGLLAVANTEAELAGVLGHEVGHVAGRHQASRYSQGVLTQLGATVLSAAIGIPAASQAIGLGSNLYMSSYSRGQESEADQLGIRYLARTGYETLAMSDFLDKMEVYQSVTSQAAGKQEAKFNYFSSHPQTEGRVAAARAESVKYPAQSNVQNRDRYISMMRGLAYGDSASQGFERDGKFYHPDLGFAFDVPNGARVDNKPARIAVEGREGTVMVLDMKKGQGANNSAEYISNVWLQGKPVNVEPMDMNGLQAATTAVGATINNQPAEVRLIAVPWGQDEFVRMQILIPQGASNGAVNDLKRLSYSFHRMTDRDIRNARPYKIDLVRAGAGDNVNSLASQMAVSKMPVEQFMALNGLRQGQPIVPNHLYKVVR